MKYFISCITTNYANFSGRARRKEYWMFTLCCLPITIILNLLTSFMGESANTLVLIVATVVGLALFLPSLAVAVRRLHDTNKSGWFYLVAFIPFIGWILLLIKMLKKGDVGENQYGPDPKALDTEE